MFAKFPKYTILLNFLVESEDADIGLHRNTHKQPEPSWVSQSCGNLILSTDVEHCLKKNIPKQKKCKGLRVVLLR